MLHRLLRIRQTGQVLFNRPEGNRPLFDASLSQGPGSASSQRTIGLAIGGLMLFVIGTVLFVAWTLQFAH